MGIESKNYIPEDVLDEAEGDPRTAFGIMALKELDHVNSNLKKQNSVEMQAGNQYTIQTPKDVWSLMDDI